MLHNVFISIKKAFHDIDCLQNKDSYNKEAGKLFEEDI